ncbi:hypothetical protein SAMN00790413_03683 [Deinococcus hopiensis KR-140]|uniref:Uncharacterized protein n=1 Tax=Deinococcus hopiensis KR-140 TaxID=695939 RepID=A0A1W1UYE4_9DEIO|nr:hypothetical protein SAMN00790413_03683 [Deinococcus hopiensis KR-140]
MIASLNEACKRLELEVAQVSPAVFDVPYEAYSPSAYLTDAGVAAQVKKLHVVRIQGLTVELLEGWRTAYPTAAAQKAHVLGESHERNGGRLPPRLAHFTPAAGVAGCGGHVAAWRLSRFLGVAPR